MKMSSYHSRKITRRRFVVYSTLSALGFGLAYSNSNKQFGINIKTTALENSLKEEIIFYNQKRKIQLNKNLKSEIIKDYKDEKTIWINKTLYTYAELNNPNKK